MNTTIEIRIIVSYADQRIVLLQIVRNQKVQKITSSGIQKSRKLVRKNRKLLKTSKDSTEQNESHKIYNSMARISSSIYITRRYFEDSLQLTNWVLY